MVIDKALAMRERYKDEQDLKKSRQTAWCLLDLKMVLRKELSSEQFAPFQQDPVAASEESLDKLLSGYYRYTPTEQVSLTDLGEPLVITEGILSIRELGAIPVAFEVRAPYALRLPFMKRPLVHKPTGSLVVRIYNEIPEEIANRFPALPNQAASA